jgi:hypothetical protein
MPVVSGVHVLLVQVPQLIWHSTPLSFQVTPLLVSVPAVAAQLPVFAQLLKT